MCKAFKFLILLVCFNLLSITCDADIGMASTSLLIFPEKISSLWGDYDIEKQRIAKELQAQQVYREEIEDRAKWREQGQNSYGKDYDTKYRTDQEKRQRCDEIRKELDNLQEEHPFFNQKKIRELEEELAALEAWLAKYGSDVEYNSHDADIFAGEGAVVREKSYGDTRGIFPAGLGSAAGTKNMHIKQCGGEEGGSSSDESSNTQPDEHPSGGEQDITKETFSSESTQVCAIMSTFWQEVFGKAWEILAQYNYIKSSTLPINAAKQRRACKSWMYENDKFYARLAKAILDTPSLPNPFAGFSQEIGQENCAMVTHQKNDGSIDETFRIQLKNTKKLVLNELMALVQERGKEVSTIFLQISALMRLPEYVPHFSSVRAESGLIFDTITNALELMQLRRNNIEQLIQTTQDDNGGVVIHEFIQYMESMTNLENALCALCTKVLLVGRNVVQEYEQGTAVYFLDLTESSNPSLVTGMGGYFKELGQFFSELQQLSDDIQECFTRLQGIDTPISRYEVIKYCNDRVRVLCRIPTSIATINAKYQEVTQRIDAIRREVARRQEGAERKRQEMAVRTAAWRKAAEAWREEQEKEKAKKQVARKQKKGRQNEQEKIRAQQDGVRRIKEQARKACRERQEKLTAARQQQQKEIELRETIIELVPTAK